MATTTKNNKYGALGSKKNLNKLVSAVTGSSGGGSKPSGNIKDNPLVFDTPAYQQQFGQTTPTMSGSQKRQIESKISKYRELNPQMVMAAEDFTKNLPPIYLPTPKPETDINAAFTANNVALGADKSGIFAPVKDAEVVTPQLTGVDSIKNALVTAGIPVPDEPPSSLDMYMDAQKQFKIKQKQQLVNDYQAQLNTLVAQSNAQQLALEGQGRGQTTQFLGGEQARIQREATIAAMPLQAQLAAAQGNLDTATKMLDQYVTLATADATNKYNYKMKLFDTVYDWASKEQQRKIEDKRIQEDRVFQEKMETIRFNHDVAVKKMSTGANEPLIKTINGIDYQYNPATGTWDVPNVSGGANQEQAQKTLDQISFLKETIAKANELSNAAGTPWFTRKAQELTTSATDYNRLTNAIDTLKTNLLTLNTDPAIKKFFGPQMTVKDTELMMSAGSTMNASSNTPADLQAELQRYSELINRIENSVRAGQSSQSFITAPNGDKVIITN